MPERATVAHAPPHRKNPAHRLPVMQIPEGGDRLNGVPRALVFLSRLRARLGRPETGKLASLFGGWIREPGGLKIRWMIVSRRLSLLACWMALVAAV